MMKIALPLTPLAAVLVCLLPVVPAQAAARDRVFVASYGSDSNPCTFGSPCKTFQQAVNTVAAGGEVTAIDSAGFGPIVIDKAVTITSPAGIEAGIVPPGGGDAVYINAGLNDAVVLRGLTMDGSASANNGIVFNAGAYLTITDCVVQNFAIDGILLQPSNFLYFVITNTTVSRNGNVGVHFLPSSGIITGVIDHVVATNGISGIVIDGTAGGGETIAISNSTASNETTGIAINGPGTVAVSIDNTGISGNEFGINANGTPLIFLGRSVITFNDTGVFNGTSANSIYSYQNNSINGNGTDIDGFSGMLNSRPPR